MSKTVEEMAPERTAFASMKVLEVVFMALSFSSISHKFYLNSVMIFSFANASLRCSNNCSSQNFVQILKKIPWKSILIRSKATDKLHFHVDIPW